MSFLDKNIFDHIYITKFLCNRNRLKSYILISKNYEDAMKLYTFSSSILKKCTTALKKQKIELKKGEVNLKKK